MTATTPDHRPCPSSAAGLEVGVTPGPRPGTVQVVVSGEIDFDNATFLRRALLAALVSHRATLLVDLERVTFCDCAGLNALLTARHTALRAGRTLYITAAGRRVERLLTLTDTRSLLT
ncbi:STAS domain-containing protein [Streptomyces sp. NBC_01214]|uniref:STAS domain-containing protein n=1 Tax=Streptomyces sp. NBC_01214 TaxID=2903777 RepID=UPI002257E09C|nr:STAS domain-containing protein [Streptomyces sp. NBC_01214]MCX4804555.1 STAS domain-containing protein [Streptomyces sp. NBC_01214]